MIFIWGKKFFGKVHQVRGVCSVATIFFHIFFFPIFPLRTYIVLDEVATPTKSENLDGWFYGVQIPLSPWSIIVGYFRGILGFLIFVYATSAISLPIEKPNHFGFGSTSHLILCGITLGLIGLFWLSRRVTRANEAHKIALLSRIAKEG